MTTGDQEGIFLLPQTAVMTADQGRFVYVLNAKNEATIRPIVAGDWVGKDWVILEGLHAGDKVIVDNLIKLRPVRRLRRMRQAQLKRQVRQWHRPKRIRVQKS